jgi:uncharacterized protein YtpQ (UPF0354 family)
MTMQEPSRLDNESEIRIALNGKSLVSWFGDGTDAAGLLKEHPKVAAHARMSEMQFAHNCLHLAYHHGIVGNDAQQLMQKMGIVWLILRSETGNVEYPGLIKDHLNGTDFSVDIEFHDEGIYRVHVLASPRAERSARTQDVPKGEAAFTEYVAAQLRRELKGAQVEVTGPLTLVVGSRLQANLGRVFTYCSRNADGCRREISAYVKRIEQLHNRRLPSQFQKSTDAVRIVVRTSAYLRASSPQKGLEAMQWRPLVGELVMLPAMDTQEAIQFLTEENNRELGLSADEVFNAGLANLQARLKPLMQVAKVVQPGQIGYVEGDVYHSSRLALHESWSRLAAAQGGKLIVAAPEWDTVLYVAEDTPSAIKALRTLTQNVMSMSPRPLSGKLLRWTPHRWEVVP